MAESGQSRAATGAIRRSFGGVFQTCERGNGRTLVRRALMIAIADIGKAMPDLTTARRLYSPH
ncbi:hypothetical protein SAMN04488047_14120 [Tranquillimonas alkanivorans]|uniref:Uncharacterized protein n=1 Tax=Tranquillimonas alkanivorans TaxID=441119 RepID=A0A1I5W826_9RHOB|nr:hypothetical protein SAMN04488047_14120 [Tranquillimonas alkanivorans]